MTQSFSRVLKEEIRGRTLIPDCLSLCDYSQSRDIVCDGIAKDLDSQSYNHKPLLNMNVPSDNYWVRPGSVPVFRDWVTYDAFAHFIGTRVDSKLNDRVFSYRFDMNGNLLSGVDQWKKSEDAFWQSFNLSPESSWIVTTDITSYYTNIDLNILRRHILTLFGKPTQYTKSIIHTLFERLLEPWAQGPIHQGIGLPQGIDASSILANLYLHYVDDTISRIPGVTYFRYMDDLRLITPDKITAKKVLRDLIKLLRDTGLDINRSKTSVLNKERANQQLLDPMAAHIDLANELVRAKKALHFKCAMPILKKIFKHCLDPENSFYQRHLSFYINRLILLRKYVSRDTRLITSTSNKFTNSLESFPGCSREICRFFRYFPSARTKDRLIAFMNGLDNIYEWQEMHLLDSLLRSSRRSVRVSDLDFFDRLARDHTRHPLCRAKAILLVGKFGDQHRRHDLMIMYNTETDTLIKRAIVVSCQQLAPAERSVFYNRVSQDPSVSHTIKYVSALPKPKYCEEENWKPFDIPDWGTY